MRLKKSTWEYGENDKKVNNWKISLNKAEAELIGMEKELDGNNKQLDENQKSLDNGSESLKTFGNNADEARDKTIKFGDIIKANLVSEAIIGGLKALGSAMINVAKKFGEIAKSGIQNASDLAESQNVVDVTFKENAESIRMSAHYPQS